MISFYKQKDILIRPIPQFEGDKKLWIQIIIKEKDSGLPIPNILVYTKNLEFAEYTDGTGWCGLQVSKDNFDKQLHIYSFNYTPVTISVPGDSVTIPVFLTLQENKLPPITLLGKKNSFLFFPSNGRLHSQKSGKIQNSLSVHGNDPLRQTQFMAGVQAHNDRSTGIKIRGAAEEATLLILDKVPVYKLDHLLGIYSAVNGDYYEEWELYKNVIPVEYGGKTNGMLRLNTLQNKKDWQMKSNINLLYTSIAAKGYITKNWGVQFGFRKSLNSGLNASLTDFSSRNSLLNDTPQGRMPKNIINNQPAFNFYDSQFKTWFGWKKHKITINGFLSNDNMDNRYFTSFRSRLFMITEKQQQTKKWNNVAGTIFYEYEKDKCIIEAQYYTTRFYENALLSYQVSRINQNIKRFDTLETRNENKIHDNGLKLKWSQKKKFPLTGGIEIVHHNNIFFFQESETPIFEVNRKVYVLSSFTGKNWQIQKNWSVNTDIRLSYLPGFKNVWVLPQVSLEYIHSKWKWQIGISKYNQAIRTLEFENFFGQRSTFFVLANETSIPVSTSLNTFSLAEFNFGNLTVLGEVYFRKTMGNLFLSRNIASLIDRNIQLSINDYTLFRGEGRYYGFDFGINYSKNNWYQSYQYSLSYSENRFEKLFNNQYFPSIEDSRHQAKIIQGYHYKNIYGQSALIYASGRPYTNVNQILESKEQINIADIETGEYQDRLPDYLRWDVAMGITFNIMKKWQSKFEISCFNVLNRKNVKYRQFYYQVPNAATTNAVLGNDISQLGRTFNLGVTISFN
ncbi:MAG: TonB-dependent receptor [Saprospiraceae bacterium]|nr:TonB-dependent receptor [Saprospiraceae bacterium]